MGIIFLSSNYYRDNDVYQLYNSLLLQCDKDDEIYLLCDSLLLECDKDDEVYSLWMVYCYRTMSRRGMLQFIITVTV